MKLHLGCGNKILEGFINIDVREGNGVDIVSDVSDLHMFERGSIDTIYACHVLEHIGRNEYKSVLKHWYDLLVPNGTLRISVPDMEKVFYHYSLNKDLNILKGFIWGGQTYPENFHYCGWDFQTICDDLKGIGFKDVTRYDWKNTEHSKIDDYSQCYLPHMDKENGMLMSLNVEAKK